jgi:prepilin-type N-terminal cleavage/methylation domain-containing protein
MHKKAFSLTELSIVVVIAAVVIAGVTQSSSLLAKAKLQSAQTVTRNSPVAGIPDLLMWFETTLDESFATTNGTIQTEDGAMVDVWNDINPQSSQKFYLINYYGPNGPTIYNDSEVRYSKSAGPNALPSIYFPPYVSLPLFLATTSDLSEVNALTTIKVSDLTIFLVYLLASENNSMLIHANNLLYSPYLDGGRYLLHSGNGNPVFYSAVSEPPLSVEMSSLTSKNSYANLYINGSNKLANKNPSFMQYSDDFLVGGGNSYISELIVFDRALKDEERQAVEQYLGKKYGVSVVKENTPDL